MKHGKGEINPRQKQLRRKNRHKTIRYVVQYALFAALLFFLVAEYVLPSQFHAYQAVNAKTAPEGEYLSAEEEGGGFVCISYSGINQLDDRESSIVSLRAFKEQMAALAASGYVTVSQQDVVDYYLYHGTLPQKALMLIFEDGIRDTTSLVQDTLQKYNFLATACTYANNLYDLNTRFLNVADCKALLKNSYWEMGTNGYRLAYINIFDRYENYFGHLNANEYARIMHYLVRDYNHWLMDFLRDEDRLRQESVEQMKQRVAVDYEGMRTVYTDSLGYVPLTYILMHSNTGMFGTDADLSAENRQHLTNLFAMNFNRQGSCWNTTASSVYDLTRMQPQPYWYTNHLLMRIWDDTGHDVAFVTGDEKEAENWYVDKGKAEFKTREIALTSEPYGYGRMALKSALLTDVEVSVRLDGNIVGEQAIYLRSDRNLEGGVRIALENNHLVVTEVGGEGELANVDLFTFDGGPFVSKQEDEHAGLVALQQAIIDYDEDEERRAQAQAELTRLEGQHVKTLAEGGEPYVPALDIADRDSRELLIRLQGDQLNIWIGDKQAVQNVTVQTTRRGTVVLESTPWQPDEDYSQRNLHDDVYDGVFTDLIIRNPADPEEVYHSYVLTERQTINGAIQDFFSRLSTFFVNNF